MKQATNPIDIESSFIHLMNIIHLFNGCNWNSYFIQLETDNIPCVVVLLITLSSTNQITGKQNWRQRVREITRTGNS